MTTNERVDYFIEQFARRTADCILWPYALSDGYGKMCLDGSPVFVHVVACTRAHGERPDGHQALHSCRNTHCFNPAHLRWGTIAENMADRRRDGTASWADQGRTAKLTLTVDQVNEIRKRYDIGKITQRELGEEYGVTRATISHIITGRRWAA